MHRHPFTALADKLPSTVPFVGPEAQERARGESFRARIGANENVFGMSPRVVEALAACGPQCWMYPDPENHELKAALAAHHGVGSENIVVGEGIDGLFGYVLRLFVEPGVKVVTSAGAYPTFNYHANGYGCELVTVPYRGEHEDPEALVKAAKDHNAAVLYLANPDNPMGTWWSAGEISAMFDALPEASVLCLDEAYCEFAPPDALAPFDVSNPKVIRFRTFSKAYGLAGLRIGYAIGQRDLITAFDKVRNHFGVNRAAQSAALAALQDQDFLQEVVARVAAARISISEIAADNGLRSIESAANFVAVDCGGDGPFARRVLGELVARGVFVRMPGIAPLDRCIRISAGRPEDLKIFAEALPEALHAANA